MNGGYILIDCNELDLTKGQTPQTITGLYNAVKTAMTYDKPIFAYNCKWGVLSVTPILVFAIQLYNDTITCTASTLQVWIKDTDIVTIVNMIG